GHLPGGRAHQVAAAEPGGPRRYADGHRRGQGAETHLGKLRESGGRNSPGKQSSRMGQS
ncbi:unnamed protein product, partial [Candidula unifasciata]